MALRTIIKEGDPVLRLKSREVGEVTERIKEMLEDMVDTMRENRGVGLAAPQVGIRRRLFVAEPNPEADPPVVYYMIDPEIYEMEGEEMGEEGCLSVPNLLGNVRRPAKIKIKAKDLDGNLQDYEFEGFEARIMCHEYDHLNGILYTDKATEVWDPADFEDDEEFDEDDDDDRDEHDDDDDAEDK